MAKKIKDVSLADLNNARFVKSASELKKNWIMNAANEGRVLILSGKPDKEVVRSQCKAEALRLMESLIEYVQPKYKKNYIEFCKQLINKDNVWGGYLSITMGARKGLLNVSRLLAIISEIQNSHTIFFHDVKFLFNKMVPARVSDKEEEKHRMGIYSGHSSYQLKDKEKETLESLLMLFDKNKN